MEINRLDSSICMCTPYGFSDFLIDLQHFVIDYVNAMNVTLSK